MTTRTGNGRTRLVASAAGRGSGPAVHAVCRTRVLVDEHGWVTIRSRDDKHGFMNTYKPGSVVELDLGNGKVLTDYDALTIAETVVDCSIVYLVSTAATGGRPVIENGTAYNADGVLHLMRLAIDRLAADRAAAEC